MVIHLNTNSSLYKITFRARNFEQRNANSNPLKETSGDTISLSQVKKKGTAELNKDNVCISNDTKILAEKLMSKGNTGIVRTEFIKGIAAKYKEELQMPTIQKEMTEARDKIEKIYYDTMYDKPYKRQMPDGSIEVLELDYCSMPGTLTRYMNGAEVEKFEFIRFDGCPKPAACHYTKAATENEPKKVMIFSFKDWRQYDINSIPIEDWHAIFEDGGGINRQWMPVSYETLGRKGGDKYVSYLDSKSLSRPDYSRIRLCDSINLDKTFDIGEWYEEGEPYEFRVEANDNETGLKLCLSYYPEDNELDGRIDEKDGTTLKMLAPTSDNEIYRWVESDL